MKWQFSESEWEQIEWDSQKLFWCLNVCGDATEIDRTRCRLFAIHSRIETSQYREFASKLVEFSHEMYRDTVN